jgi:hypothetical protein
VRFWAKLCNAQMREHAVKPLTAAAPSDALIMTRNRYIGIYPYEQWAVDAEQHELQLKLQRRRDELQRERR